MANLRLSTQSSDAEIDAEIDAALAAAREYEAEHGPHPAIARIEYLEASRILVFHFKSGMRLPVAVENLQGLEKATPEQLRNYQLLGPGTGIFFPGTDAAFHVDGLIEGVYGSRKWMAQLGAQGGASRSDRKTSAARANGAKGGRPRKKKVPA